MAPNRALALALSVFSLALSGCTKLRSEIQKKLALTNLLDSWIDKPIHDFLNQTGWVPTSEYTWKHSGRKKLEFNALNGNHDNGAGGTVKYKQVNNGFVVPEGSYQLHPMNAQVDIPGHGGASQTGCKLQIIINTDGRIRSWSLQGGEFFTETLDSLKLE